MAKMKTLRRILLPCFTPPTTPTTAPATQYRLSTSLRDDIPSDTTAATTTTITNNPSHLLPTDDDSVTSRVSHAPPRPSKSMVLCTFFGARRSHVFFCVQHDRLSTKPSLLLELSLSTHSLVKEMRSGLLRLALECNYHPTPEKPGYCPLQLVPRWTVYCNGRKVGSAARRRAGEDVKILLKKMENMTVGAGVIPSSVEDGGNGNDEVMYMRANYEWVVGGADSESFHLISPDDCPGQELSVFLLRSSK